jgi:hypothetical protein
MSMETSAPSTAAGFIFWLLIALFYFLPTAVAQHRGRESWQLIGFANLLLGCTVVGWFVLLIVAFTGENGRQRKLREQEAQLRQIDAIKRDEELILLRQMAANQAAKTPVLPASGSDAQPPS